MTQPTGRIPQATVTAAITPALLAFPFVAVVVGAATRSTASWLVNFFYGHNIPFTLPIKVFLWGLQILVPASVAFFVCRALYRRLRWPVPGVGTDRFCEYCGYDLTGNTSGVCPECGKDV